MFLILLRFGLLRFRNLKQRHITLIQRHMPHNAAAAAFCVTDRAGIQSIDRMLSPPPPVSKHPYAALVCRLMVSTPVIHVITWLIIHLTTPGWKAELA